MTHLLVQCEKQVEDSINVATMLAVQDKDKFKELEISFSSKLLMEVFVNNLIVHWYSKDINPLNGVKMSLYIPGNDDEADY
tara:strand:- start:206 stop:448 length:243 start_codon:yes stop_codon:yes gene_type:complete